MGDPESKITMNQAQSRFIKVSLFVIFFGIFIYAIHPILMPFIFGALIAYLGDPLVDKLEKFGFPRTLAVLVVFAFFLAIMIFMILLVLPPLISEFETFASAVPGIYASIVNDWIPNVRSYIRLNGGPIGDIDWPSRVSENWGTLGQVTTSLAQKFADSSIGFVGFLANLVLIPVVGFYLLRDWDIIIVNVLELTPSTWRQRVEVLMNESDEAISAFIRGQLLVMLALGMIYSLGLSLLGIQMALVLGVTAGLASIIPYLGFVVGVTIASFAGYYQYHDWEMIGLVWMVFIFGQVLESVFLTPVLIGDKIGLHPVIVIFSLMAGGVIAGFVGLLVAIPIAAILMVFLRHLISEYRQSDFYQS